MAACLKVQRSLKGCRASGSADAYPRAFFTSSSLRARMRAALAADWSWHALLTPKGKVGACGKSAPNYVPKIDGVGWTATTVAAGVTAPSGGLVVPASVACSAIGASSGASSTAAAFRSVVAGPMVLQATLRSPSSVASRRAWLAIVGTKASCAAAISALHAEWHRRQ